MLSIYAIKADRYDAGHIASALTDSILEIPMPARRDISGQRFGNLVAVRFADAQSGPTRFIFNCDCGNALVAISKNVINGRTQSCGCLRNTRVQEACTTHGASKSRLYQIWTRMKGRCGNPSSSDYDYYGGRGITVASDWLEFQAFQDWALANGYDDALTIDRIDGNGNYCADNCRWISIEAQQRNRRPRRWAKRPA
jgi:hypothetical protein